MICQNLITTKLESDASRSALLTLLRPVLISLHRDSSVLDISKVSSVTCMAQTDSGR